MLLSHIYEEVRMDNQKENGTDDKPKTQPPPEHQPEPKPAEPQLG